MAQARAFQIEAVVFQVAVGFFNPHATAWVDQPASYHCGAAGFSFADGHSEIHKWLDSLNTPKAKAVNVNFTGVTATVVKAGDRDIHWMSYHGGRKMDKSY